MTIATVAELVGVVTASRLLDQSQQQVLVNELQREFTDATKLARAIVKRGWLTAFQIKMLANNRGSDLVLGQYLLLDILGEGGMGQVFKARQRKLDRIVALKVIRKERLSNPDAVRRFQREMHAASQLTHPNIVLAFDADEVGDRQFIVMEYVEGVDLGKMVKQQGALLPAQACDYAAQAASGLQHAHERGLVHRDIKPSNLLVTKPPAKPGVPGPTTGLGSRWGMVKILDMGLARATENSQMDMSGTLTQAGAVVGTPDYVSPEQARDSRSVDIRSDLYSLGCTLYFLLTARVPFPGGTPMEKLFKHQLEPCTPVEQLRPDLPPGVADAVGRLMAKNPADRPQTPADAARLLAPLAAQTKPGAIQPAARSNLQPGVSGPEVETADAIRRKRTSGLAGATVPVQSPPMISTPVRRLPFSRSVLIGMGAAFLALVGIVYFSLGGLSSDSSRSTDGNAIRGTDGKPTDKPSDKPKSPLDQLNASQIPAGERWPGLAPEVVAVLGNHRFRHWGPINAGAISPDGKWLATIGGDRQVRVWNIATGEQRTAWPVDVPGPPGFLPGGNITFTPNGQTVVAIVGNQMLKSWDVNSGRVVTSLPGARIEGRPMSLAPGGHSALWSAREGITKLIDPISHEDRGELKGLTGAYQIGWSADGKTFAAWTRAGRTINEISVWDATTAKLRRTISLPDGMAGNAALSPDGQTIAAVVSKDTITTLKIWNTVNGEEVVSRKLNAMPFQLIFLPDGKQLVMASGHGVQVQEAASGQERTIPIPVGGGAASFVFSPDGRVMALLSSWEPMVRLYDFAAGKPLYPSDGFYGQIGSQVFTPDGKSLLAGAGFGRPGVRVIDLPGGNTRATIGEGQQGMMVLGITPDSKSALTRGAGGLTLWDLATGTAKATSPSGGQLVTVACTPDCMTVFTQSAAGPKFWDGTTLQPRPPIEGLKGQLFYVSLSADGTRCVTGEYQPDGKSRIRLWDPIAGKEIPFNVQLVNGNLMSVLISPDGKWVAASTAGGLRIWDMAGQERLTLLAEGGPMQTFGFLMAASPTGDSLLAWNNRQMKLFDPVAGKERATLNARSEGMTSGVFSPDGKLVASGDRTGRVVIWNAATGSEINRFTMPGGVFGLHFAPDSRHLATNNMNGTIYILRLAGG